MFNSIELGDFGTCLLILSIAGFCYYQFGIVNPRRMEESFKKSQDKE